MKKRKQRPTLHILLPCLYFSPILSHFRFFLFAAQKLRRLKNERCNSFGIRWNFTAIRALNRQMKNDVIIICVINDAITISRIIEKKERKGMESAHKLRYKLVNVVASIALPSKHLIVNCLHLHDSRCNSIRTFSQTSSNDKWWQIKLLAKSKRNSFFSRSADKIVSPSAVINWACDWK